MQGSPGDLIRANSWSSFQVPQIRLSPGWDQARVKPPAPLGCTAPAGSLFNHGPSAHRTREVGQALTWNPGRGANHLEGTEGSPGTWDL